MTGVNTKGILAALRDEAERLGRLDKVRGHESKNAPGRELSMDMWVRSCGPAPARSGLAATSALLVVDLRIYRSMLAEPQDAIDPDVCDAADALIEGITANFTLGGLIGNVDIHNAHGGGRLGWTMAYLQLGGGGDPNNKPRHFRCATVTVPMVINDVWPQSAVRM